jgi:CheY-like chemotaxis protein/HPt (histidine-containing phosphotransfer) domain-containing protein
VLLVEADEDARRAARSVSDALAGEVDLVVVPTIEDAMKRISSRPPCAIVVAVDATHVDASPFQAKIERACAEHRERLVYALPPQSPDASAEWLEDWSPSIVKPIRRSRIRALVAQDRPRMAKRDGAVLIVDDEAVNRAVLRGLVEHRGLRAVEASSGELGLRELASGHFDVVLSDLHMPDMDGARFIELARARGFRGWAIAQTASVREQDRDRCLGAGFDAFLRKPFQPADLEAALDRRTDPAPDAAPPSVRLVEDATWLEIASLMADTHDELVRSYFVSAREHLDDLRRQLHDGRAARSTAHALASSSLMIGLVGVGNAARALETVAESLGVDERAARISELSTLLEATCDHPMLRALPRSIRCPGK